MRDVDWRMCLRFINEGKIGRKQPLRHGCAVPPPLSGEASRCGGDGVRRSARTPDHGEQKRPAISVAGTQYSPSLHFRCQPDIGILHRGKIGKMRPALVVFQ